jgi:hypothetical protein
MIATIVIVGCVLVLAAVLAFAVLVAEPALRRDTRRAKLLRSDP